VAVVPSLRTTFGCSLLLIVKETILNGFGNIAILDSVFLTSIFWLPLLGKALISKAKFPALDAVRGIFLHCSC